MPAFGSDWILLSVTQDGKHYYKEESIETKNNILKVWTMTDYMTPRKDKKGRLIVRDTFLSEINCKEHAVKPVSVTKTFEDKSKVKEYVKGFAVKVDPDSFGALLLKAVCR
jgi:hypothetical protein